ncbi:MAG: type III pantothenate kinase [Phycisphaerae bacterium]|nr:type III pantothenate kinase [Phycisphaerae bacterium]
MNVIAVDIGNTNIHIGLFVQDQERPIESIPGRSRAKLTNRLRSAWQEIPIVEGSTEGKRDGVIVVSSVKPLWTGLVRQIAADELDEEIHVIGQDIPLPMTLGVDEPEKVGTDRVVSAAAAWAVTEDAVVVADFGTAVTIDLVDENGVFLGGVICPGFEISAKSLKENTAQLPKAEITKPKAPYGKNTAEAINCGLYYSAVGTLEEVIRRYAEKIGKWPRTVITGSAARAIKDDCNFIDSYVPSLVVKGIVLAYKKHLAEKTV